MCGIFGVVSRPSSRPVPTADQLLSAADAALAARPDVEAVTAAVRALDAELRGVPGVVALAGRFELSAGLVARLDQLDAFADDGERALEADDAAPDVLEQRAVALSALRDALWAVRGDRLRTADAVGELAGRDASASTLAGYLAIQQTLSAIDRLEVRGRDSAGVHVFVWDHGLDPSDPAVTALVGSRATDPLYPSGAVRWAEGCLSFVYKAAAEIGELGDNTRVIRAAVAADDLLRRAVAHPDSRVAVLGHTRWASVGIISEPNTHPLNSEELPAGDDPPVAANDRSPDVVAADDRSPYVVAANDRSPYVVAALNGDVDNHADLRVEHELRIPGPITTDAKVIPALVGRALDGGADLVEAFRRTVASFEGSVAIAATSADAPGTLLLALRGSGQGLYVGLADDRYVVASEPYGVVEETDRYVRMDGESGGEIVVLDADGGGALVAVRRLGYDGVERPLTPADVVTAEVTTRDIDRGDAAHFLLKEMHEAPDSFRKTLRGRIVERAGMLHASVGERALPADVAARLADGSITRIRVIGQGTAAVAGQSTASLLNELLGGALDVVATTATELSGFGMRLDMRDTLAIAVSQSGTTTDTNRTVDLLRARGAAVIGIVNRRGSDLVDKADGVMFTSDGRDVEMSVASTKAFYSQVAAGALLACAIAEAAGHGDVQRRHHVLAALRELPAALREVLARRDAIAEAAHRLAPGKRYWAVVGNGPNRVAAEEVRIKLSELCYKSISCDATEDKKHIDLSSEPLILVCAAGLRGGTATDVAKETAIFRAHKATPVVIADDGETRYTAAAVITVPPVDPALGFVLSAMVGHLFGYEAALAIDATARPLREARETIERVATAGAPPDESLARLRHDLVPHVERFHELMLEGRYDGQLEASTATRLEGVLRDLLAPHPVEEFQRRTGQVGTPASLIDEVAAALTHAIEELTRPVDAIKHQAKTVTVGISRSDEGVLDRSLVQATLAAGAGRDTLSYRTLKVLADLDPAVDEVLGFTRYAIDGGYISVIDRGGIARDLPSRVRAGSVLAGTKRRVAEEREVLVGRGRADGRTIIFVPEVKAGTCVGITLLHVRFAERLTPAVMRSVLQGYDRRYDRLVDWVVETEGVFDETRLGELPVVDLLIKPISETADLWRS